jgi:outer membrane protein OmpA-like peptidoglycan-associated protein
MANSNRIFIRRVLIELIFLLCIAAGAESGWQQPGDIEQPHGTWQVPGPIQQPNGFWQKPGPIRAPKGIQAIKQESLSCESRISVGADALFDFDRSELRSDAAETLEELGPILRSFGAHPIEIDGHTDALGSLSYNQQLSEARAETVKTWLVSRDLIPVSTPIKGYGKTRPVAPNKSPDGSDNPVGRQKNRRVEILINTCKQTTSEP